jgi:hypothetical protein
MLNTSQDECSKLAKHFVIRRPFLPVVIQQTDSTLRFEKIGNCSAPVTRLFKQADPDEGRIGD